MTPIPITPLDEPFFGVSRLFPHWRLFNFEAMRTQIFWLGAVAMAGVVYAADVEVKAKADTDRPKVEAEVKSDRDRRPGVEYRQEARIESPVKANNKASNIIGMQVHNRQDEKLGEIKDVVLDLQSGKIGYVVL